MKPFLPGCVKPGRDGFCFIEKMVDRTGFKYYVCIVNILLNDQNIHN